MEHAATPQAERRKSPRTTLDKILYLNLEPHNGGIVLNVSDGGMAFHAIAPIQEGNPIRFWFSLAGVHDREASGELVWTDKTKKVCGLRFTELPDTTRGQIRDLLGDLKILPKAETSPVRSPAQPQAPEPVPAQSLPAPIETSVATPAEHPQPLPGFRKGDGQGPPYDIDYWVSPAPEERSPIARGFGAGFLIVVLIAVAAITVYVERQSLGAAFVAIGEKLGATAQQAPAQQAATPNETPPAAVAPSRTEPPTETAPAAPPAAPSVAQEPSAVNSLITNEPPAEAGAATPPAATDGGEADLAAARRYLDGVGTPRSSATAAQFLWAAVEKGSGEAELVLAGLYLRGDGVTKSCEQARVLLGAASSKGNAEATESLANLYRNGCS